MACTIRKSNPAITATQIRNQAIWMGTLCPHGLVAHSKKPMLPPRTPLMARFTRFLISGIL